MFAVTVEDPDTRRRIVGRSLCFLSGTLKEASPVEEVAEEEEDVVELTPHERMQYRLSGLPGTRAHPYLSSLAINGHH